MTTNTEFPAYTVPVEVTLPSGRTEPALIRPTRPLSLEDTPFTYVLFPGYHEVTLIHSTRVHPTR